MKKVKVLMTTILSVAMVTGSLLPGIGRVTATAEETAIAGPRIETGESSTTVTWDKVKLGTYEQSTDETMNPIKWRILDADDGTGYALVVADCILESHVYSTGSGDNWKNSKLREWLNDDFYKEIFTSQQQSAIASTTIGTGDTQTTDNLFLLSQDEVMKQEYGFNSASARSAQLSKYMQTKEITGKKAGTNAWWLRMETTTSSPAFLDYVLNNGGIAQSFYDYNMGVRPAMRINLSSAAVSDGGTVTSDGDTTQSAGTYGDPVIADDGTVTWDCIYVGKYVKYFKDQLEWRVLSVEGNYATLLSENVMECQPFNTQDANVTWETSSIRTWLNNDFYNAAFSNAEKEGIVESLVINDDNPQTDNRDGGNNTKDKVYLLSATEITKNAYGFSGWAYNEQTSAYYLPASNGRKVTVTSYAAEQAQQTSSDCTQWLLRTPGCFLNYMMFIDGNGNYSSFWGINVNGEYRGIRPVIRVDLSKISLSKSGTVSATDSDFVTNSNNQEVSYTKEPAAKVGLTYTGQEQSLISAGEVTGGTLVYSLDGCSWSEDIPKATTPGTYSVYYKAVGAFGYNDTQTVCVNATIAKLTPTIVTLPTASAITAGQKLGESTLTGGSAKCGEAVIEGTFAWKNASRIPDASDEKSYEVVFTPTNTQNYYSVICKVPVKVSKVDNEEPSQEENNDSDDVKISADTDSSTDTKTDTTTDTTVKVSGQTYKVTSSNAVTYLAPKNKKVKSVTIPSKVKVKGKSYKVTAIDQKAFQNCKKLKSITIQSKTIKKVGKKAFKGCKKLKKVVVKSTKIKSLVKKAVKKSKLKVSKVKIKVKK
ncbi:MAG: leucine-rich repeat domain-containing protein [Eubacterium sp.]|nr:leucine-rich repeat domain-containing protein [Eubacterium sp.]